MNALDGLLTSSRQTIVGAVLALVFLFSSTAMAQTISYAKDVFPILELRCVECHQPGGDGFEKSGLNLLTYAGLMKGTKFGPVVVPRNAMTSNLIAVIDHRTNKKIWMPHERRQLASCERRALRFWIDQGARDN